MTNHRGPQQTVFVGDVFDCGKWGAVAVVKYEGTANVTVQFEDGNQTKTHVSALRLGIVKNPFVPSVAGVGYLGDSHRSYPGGAMRHTPEYKAWAAMLKRCYDEKHYNKYAAYRGCSVSEEWHDFSVFSGWYKQQVGYNEGWQLDKDLKVKGNKTYSSSTCSLVPREINNILENRKACRGKYPIGVHFNKANGSFIAQMNRNSVNTYIGSFNTPESAFIAYKTDKEAYVKVMAESYREVLSDVVYNNLINFTVDITD